MPGDYSSPDFAKVAASYGMKSSKITIESNISDEIKKVLNYDGPVLCEVMIDNEQKLNPKLEFGNPLEDMFPYMTDDELSNNMIVDMVQRRDNTQGWVTLEK